MTCHTLVEDQNILGGVPVFRHTRVPFQALLDYLEGGKRLTTFSVIFPPLAGKPRLPVSKKQRRSSSHTLNENPSGRMRPEIA